MFILLSTFLRVFTKIDEIFVLVGWLNAVLNSLQGGSGCSEYFQV